jgi:hypothetical protein
MTRLVESIRKKSPLTLYGVFLLALLLIFIGCMGYCLDIILSDGVESTTATKVHSEGGK